MVLDAKEPNIQPSNKSIVVLRPLIKWGPHREKETRDERLKGFVKNLPFKSIFVCNHKALALNNSIET